MSKNFKPIHRENLLNKWQLNYFESQLQTFHPHNKLNTIFFNWRCSLYSSNIISRIDCYDIIVGFLPLSEYIIPNF